MPHARSQAGLGTGTGGALPWRGGDAKDPNLPLMIWYSVEAAVATHRDRAMKLLASTKIPILRQHLTRRIATLK